MLQHFLRYVRDENWLLFLKHPRRRPNSCHFGSDLEWRCVRVSIELKHAQTILRIV